MGDEHNGNGERRVGAFVSRFGAAIAAGILSAGVTYGTLSTELDTLRSRLDAQARRLDTFDRDHDVVIRLEAEVAALDRLMRASDSATTDQLRAVAAQLDYLLKNVPVRR